MYIEITGEPGVGKSYCSGHLADDTYLKYPITDRILSVVFELFSLPFFLMLVNPKILIYCVKYSFKADHRLLFKLNVFRNVIKKIVFFRLTSFFSSKNFFVDEGISHLPFLFAITDKDEFITFCTLFSAYLSKLHLVRVSSSNEIIKSRVLARGHKRLTGKNDEYREEFFKNNRTVAILINDVMSKQVASYEVIEN